MNKRRRFNGWKPIDMAPRDGTAILVTDGQVQRVAWTQHPVTDGNVYVWTYYVTRGGGFATMAAPTHWMPLPELPK